MNKRNNLFIGLTGATAILAAPFIMSACQTTNSQQREQGTMMSAGDGVSEKKCLCQEEGKKDALCQCGQCGCGEKGKEGDPAKNSCGG